MNNYLADNLMEHFAAVEGTPDETVSESIIESSNIQDVTVGLIELMLKKVNKRNASILSEFLVWISVEAAEDLCIPMHVIITSML